MNKVRLVQGNEACAMGALAAGSTFYAGYPITPSTEIAEYMARELPKIGGIFLQMEDEIASMGAIIGASCTGVKAFTATSGPGFSLMQELIGYAAMTEIPCVIVDVQRPGPSTALPTLSSQGDVQQARWGCHGFHSIIAIAPSSIMEIYYQMINAFNLAEKYRTPVIFLMDEEIGHLRERFELPDGYKPEIINRKKPESDLEVYLPYVIEKSNGVPPMANFGDGYRYHISGLTHNEKGFYSSVPSVVDAEIRRMVGKIEDNVDDIAQFEAVGADDCDVLVIAYGSVARSAQEAVEAMRERGISVGLLRPIVLWPFPTDYFTKACMGKKAVVVAEMNLGQYAREIRRVVHTDIPLKCLTRVDGEFIYPDDVISAVGEVL